MCKFEIKVSLCKCLSPTCTQRNPEIADDQLPPDVPGHTIRVMQYYRISSICPGWFINKRPDRLMLQYKIPQWNANSKQDCLLKELVHHKDIGREGRMCRACRKGCVQPPPEEKIENEKEVEKGKDVRGHGDGNGNGGIGIGGQVMDLAMRERLLENLEAANAEGQPRNMHGGWPLETHPDSHRLADN